VQVRKPPASLGFEAFARIGVNEYRMGTFCAAAEKEKYYGLMRVEIEEEDEEAQTIMLVLRSSDRPVRESVELEEMWEGEVVFEKVDVEVVREEK